MGQRVMGPPARSLVKIGKDLVREAGGLELACLNYTVRVLGTNQGGGQRNADGPEQDRVPNGRRFFPKTKGKKVTGSKSTQVRAMSPQRDQFLRRREGRTW